jgi:hypothetical protein
VSNDDISGMVGMEVGTGMIDDCCDGGNAVSKRQSRAGGP